MSDYIELGPVPCDEECEQLGNGYDSTKAYEECQKYKRQLQKMFPDGVFAIKSFPHDYGSYYEVVIKYNDDDEKSMEYAFDVESKLPANWE